MVADRVVASSGAIEDNQSEIAGAVGRHGEAPPKHDGAVLGTFYLIAKMTAQTEFVANPTEQRRVVSPVGKMATLATKPVNRSVSDPIRTPRLVLVTGETDPSSRRPQQTRLARRVGRVAVDALRNFNRRVRNRRLLNLAFEVSVAGIAESRTPIGDQLRNRPQMASGARVDERGVDRAGCEQRSDRGPMGVVALDTRQRGHVGAKVGC